MAEAQSPLTMNSFANGNLARGALIALGGSVFLAGMSQIAVGWPIPTTLQTLAVMVIGLTFGFRLATATVALYLFEGFIGLPVFAQFKPLFPVGPSVGYLVGFMVEAALIGFLVDRGYSKTYLGSAFIAILGELAMFACGVAWLIFFIDQPSMIAKIKVAIEVGVVPFIAVDLIKLALAVLVAKGFSSSVARFIRL